MSSWEELIRGSLAVGHNASTHFLEALELELRLVLIGSGLLHLYVLDCHLMSLGFLSNRHSFSELFLFTETKLGGHA